MNLRGRTQNYSKIGPNGGPAFEGMAEQHLVVNGYRQIVANHRRQYPHQVKFANAGEWCDRHCSHKAREIMPGPLVQWFEGAGDGVWVYGFKTAEQAAAFKGLSESCGIDWSVPASDQPP